MRYRTPILIFCFLTSLSLYAQDGMASKLRWTVTSLTDLNSNTTSDYSATFETNGTQTILWLQKNGTRTTSLAVNGTEGNWINVQTDGKVVFQITTGGRRGVITFERIASKTHVVLDLTTNINDGMRYDFLVSTVTTIP